MADELLERRVGQHASVGAQEAGGEIDADNAAAVADRGELPVGQVARVRAERVRIRMRGDERRVGQRGDVPKALLVQMREVDQDPELVAGLDQRLALIGQARAGIRRAREAERNAVAENVRPAPDRAERAQARLVEHFEHAGNRGRSARRPRSAAPSPCAPASTLARISAALRQTRTRAVRPPRDAEEERDHLQRDALRVGQLRRRRQRHVVGRGLRIMSSRSPSGSSDGHEDGEEAADEAAGLRARQVEMARRRRRRGTTRRRRPARLCA